MMEEEKKITTEEKSIAQQETSVRQEEKVASEATQRGKGRRINKKKSTVILAVVLVVEICALLGLNMFLFDYGKVAPQSPTEYANAKEADKISYASGKLMVNDVSVAVPDDGNAEYSIAYSWGKEDKDYPSVPKAAVATYSDKQQKKESNQKNTDKENETGEENIVYEISLFKSEHYAKADIPQGKTTENWFSDWKEEKTNGIVKTRLKQGNIEGFLISSLKAEDYSDEYKSYNYSFAITEADGISVYTIEGICYDPTSLGTFSTIMEGAVKTIELKKLKK